MGDAEVFVDLGSEEGRAQAAQHESVDDRGMDVALDDRLGAEVGERHADRVVAAGRAVDEEPAATRPPSLGGQRLRLLEGDVEGVGTDVDALDAGREVEAQAASPIALAKAGIGAGAALVPGDVEAARVGVGELDQGVEVRRPALIHGVHRSARAADRPCGPRTRC